jgi:hypothetical protein
MTWQDNNEFRGLNPELEQTYGNGQLACSVTTRAPGTPTSKRVLH